jgi:hypothetical protein
MYESWSRQSFHICCGTSWSNHLLVFHLFSSFFLSVFQHHWCTANNDNEGYSPEQFCYIPLRSVQLLLSQWSVLNFRWHIPVVRGSINVFTRAPSCYITAIFLGWLVSAHHQSCITEPIKEIIQSSITLGKEISSFTWIYKTGKKCIWLVNTM